MNKLATILAAGLLSISLAGCNSLTLNQVGADIQQFFQTANADLAAAWQGIQNDCTAIQTVANTADTIVCKTGANQNAQKAVAKAQAAVTGFCNAANPSDPNFISAASIAAAQAYSAIKQVQAGNCGS